MSTRRSQKRYSTKQEMGTNGRLACLECGGDITAPRRKTFCGAGCSDNFQIRTNPGFARRKVFERDKGICSACGKNTFDGQIRKPRANGTGDLWQADHIIPVVEGGGECGLDGLRTLCTACHRLETAALARRRAAKRIKEKPLPIFEQYHDNQPSGV